MALRDAEPRMPADSSEV